MVRFWDQTASQPTRGPQCTACSYTHSCSRHSCVYPGCERSRVDPLRPNCWTCEYHVGLCDAFGVPSQPGPVLAPQPNLRDADAVVHPKHDSSADGGGKPDAPEPEKTPEVEKTSEAERTHPAKHRHSRFRSMLNWKSFGSSRKTNQNDDNMKDPEKSIHDPSVTLETSTPAINDAEKKPPPASTTPQETQETKSSTSVAPSDSEPLSQGAPPSLLVETLRLQEAEYLKLKLMMDLDPSDPWAKWLTERRIIIEQERDQVGWHQCHAPACQDRVISETIWVCQKHLDAGLLDRDDPPGFLDCPAPKVEDTRKKTRRRGTKMLTGIIPAS